MTFWSFAITDWLCNDSDLIFSRSSSFRSLALASRLLWLVNWLFRVWLTLSLRSLKDASVVGRRPTLLSTDRACGVRSGDLDEWDMFVCLFAVRWIKLRIGRFLRGAWKFFVGIRWLFCGLSLKMGQGILCPRRFGCNAGLIECYSWLPWQSTGWWLS